MANPSSKGPFVTGDQVELVVGDRKSEWYLGRIVNCKVRCIDL